MKLKDFRVDRIYVINIESHTHRMRYMEYMLEKYQIPLLSLYHDVYIQKGVQVHSSPYGFRGPPGAYGCTESHLECLRHAQQDDTIQTVMVLEDDCIVHKQFWQMWDSAEIPDDWNMIYLGAIQMNWGHIQFINHKVYKARNTLSSHAYILQSKDIPMILDIAKKSPVPIDEVFSIAQTKMKGYVLYPNLCINHVNQSYVRSRNTWSIENQQSRFRWTIQEYDTEKTPLSFVD